MSAVTAASSATGKSLVPAHTTAMVPARLGQRLPVDGQAAGGLVVNGVAEIAASAAGHARAPRGSPALAGSCSSNLAAIFTTWFGVLPAPKITSGNRAAAPAACPPGQSRGRQPGAAWKACSTLLAAVFRPGTVPATAMASVVVTRRKMPQLGGRVTRNSTEQGNRGNRQGETQSFGGIPRGKINDRALHAWTSA